MARRVQGSACPEAATDAEAAQGHARGNHCRSQDVQLDPGLAQAWQALPACREAGLSVRGDLPYVLKFR